MLAHPEIPSELRMHILNCQAQARGQMPGPEGGRRRSSIVDSIERVRRRRTSKFRLYSELITRAPKAHFQFSWIRHYLQNRKFQQGNIVKLDNGTCGGRLKIKFFSYSRFPFLAPYFPLLEFPVL